MSLLMQALRKAERAGASNDAAAAALASMEPAGGLSLSPLAASDGAAPPPEAGTGPEPEVQREAGPGAYGAYGARATGAMAVPARTRIAILCGILLLIVAGFGYRYWQARHEPGAGASLPMVPMPQPDLPDASNPALEQMAPVDAGMLAVAPAPAAAMSEAPAPMPAAPAAAMRATSPEDALSASRRSEAHAGVAPAMPTPLPAIATAEADGSGITVTHNNAAPRINPLLESAFQAFNDGDNASAQRQYEALLAREPNHHDALLGLAATALRQGDTARAQALYRRLLELDPDDADALAGLHQGDPGQDEPRLRAALRRTPDAAALLFALGNLYAGQGRWPQAQQAYFRAVGAAPDNPDYAFNLAVGLDRLSQGRLARGYYQRALDLARQRPAGFDPDAARRRLRQLDAAAGQP